ncbi:MAG: hypothetical protein AAB647_00735 [Patescibacteria group bacterium]
MTHRRSSRRVRFLLTIPFVLLLAFFVSGDLATREEAYLNSQLKADSTGVKSLLNDRLSQSNDPAGLVKLGYRLASADQCDLALPVFDRTQTLNAGYRDTALLAGWCQLKLAQSSTSRADQQAKLALAKTLVSQGRLIDPLDTFGQTLQATLDQVEVTTP